MLRAKHVKLNNLVTGVLLQSFIKERLNGP